MADEQNLRPATPDEIADTLAHGLIFRAGKRVHHADNFMARMAADILVRQLELSGFVIMRKPPSQFSSTRGYMPTKPGWES